MKRLTERRKNGAINVRYATEHETAIHRLAAIEDILCDSVGDNDPDAEDEYDLDRLTVMCNQRMSMRDEVSERFSLMAKIPLDRLRELAKADREGRCVVLNMPRKPLVWGDDDQNTCLCPYCGKDLMGIPYGERMVLQCPECGQYLDATKVITREEAEAALAKLNSGT